MPDHSRDNISRNHANVAIASEGQIWNSMNSDQRAQLLGQSIAGEADNSNIKNSVYQQGEGRVYETTPYTSLPAHIQNEVSKRLHEAGYFQETFGGHAYEVEGDDRFECKDCEETFVAQEDFRVHRKVNHDDNGESETESQEAYFRALEIDPSMTKDNLEWARKLISGESSRQEFPQNDPDSTLSDPPLPKGRKEYDDNPNHYFYDNKLFKRGSRGGNYDTTGTALTEARALIELEDKIFNKYGWDSTRAVEKNPANRQVFATEIAKEVNVSKLNPRTIRILDSVNKPFLVNTLSQIASEAHEEGDQSYKTDPTETPIEDIPYRGKVDDGAGTQDIEPFSKQGEPVIHQDYNPEHPHEHNAFDLNFGDKVAEEQQELEAVADFGTEDTSDYEVDVPELLKTGEPVQEVPEDKRAEEQEEGDRTCKDCGDYFSTEEELHSHVQDHEKPTVPAKEDFPFESEEEQTTVTAEPDLLQNVNTDVLEIEGEQYNPNEEYDEKAKESRTIQQYTGYKAKASEGLDDILDGAIDVPVEQQTVDETIYDRKLDGYHEDKIARELGINHDIEYEDAIEKIRSIEVNNDDRVAKTIFGKKLSDCTEAEISEMKMYAGEAKRSTEKKAQ